MTLENEKPERIKWMRDKAPFEAVLGKYQLEIGLKLLQGPRVLDIGCGNGTLTKELSKYFIEVVGIDGSGELIEEAQKNVEHVTFQHILVEGYKPEKRFNSVFMSNVLEHLENPISTLKLIRTWLECDGYVVIQVPNALSLNRRIGRYMGLIDDHYTLDKVEIEKGHRRWYDIKILEKTVVEAGFEITQSGGIFLKPLSNQQMEGLCSAIPESEQYCDALFAIGKELPDYCSVLYAQCRRT